MSGCRFADSVPMECRGRRQEDLTISCETMMTLFGTLDAAMRVTSLQQIIAMCNLVSRLPARNVHSDEAYSP